MHDEARIAVQPLLPLGVVVGGVVVHEQMQAQVLGRTAVGEPQEFQPIAMAVPRLTLSAGLRCAVGDRESLPVCASSFGGKGSQLSVGNSKRFQPRQPPEP